MVKTDRLRALQHQSERLSQRIARMQQISHRWMWARVLSFLAAIAASALALFFVDAWLFWVSLVGLGVIFIGIVLGHRRLEQSLLRHETLRDIQQAQIARMRLDWDAVPPPFEGTPRYDHPFEGDIDLVGQRSVHRLLDVTTTTGGSRLLRQWLSTTTPTADDVAQRQALVKELAPLSLFRTRLMLRGALVATNSRESQPGVDATETNRLSHKTDATHLAEWFAGGGSPQRLRRWLFVLSGLALLNVLLLLLHGVGVLPMLWPYTLALYGILTYYVTSAVANAESKGDIFREAAALQSVLGQMATVFHELESFSYRQQPHLKQLCQPFLDPRERPSRYIQQLARITNATGLRGNPLLWFALNVVLPWDIFFAYQLARCKASIARHIDEWLTIWYEIEALSSLANLAYLNPHYTFPTVRTWEAGDDQQPIFATEGLAHPLLPDVETALPKVRNDFTVDALGRSAILTGSNMAGKSTFLKAIAVNLALTYAGGPVDAQRLETGLFRLFTCIKVSDSVTDGISYFYAEVQRLQRLLEELRQPDALPLFYCIDEIFRGTNNRERLIGSRAYIQALAGQNGSGLISTHDLELVRLADATPLITNYHFRDDVQGDRMTFDYQLRPGPCPTTNALRIMALAGLPVNDEISITL